MAPFNSVFYIIINGRLFEVLYIKLSRAQLKTKCTNITSRIIKNGIKHYTC